VGTEDVLGQRLMQLDLVTNSFCFALEPPGHKGECNAGAR
jgi:hypothetical protein